jgi:hypothetical protein
VELKNVTGAPVSLNGWSLGDEDDVWSVRWNVNVVPGGYALLVLKGWPPSVPDGVPVVASGGWTQGGASVDGPNGTIAGSMGRRHLVDRLPPPYDQASAACPARTPTPHRLHRAGRFAGPLQRRHVAAGGGRRDAGCRVD